ncbi:MAG TPA: PEP/pyruvate-binding domain-containing protein [Phycisphaerae bacterium]|nr:PEP/pyruvate-binding domain-containing protein [Phycisphaerae bacterium]HRR83709.1 PEP/pyruvate-binding domain-containing protein [Phycisphaerae bacterium]
MISTNLSTGLPALDRVLKGLLPGDNLVWRVDTVDDYRVFLEPFCRNAVSAGKRLVYYRFADHAPLVPADCPAEIHELQPELGFEKFISSIHEVVKSARGLGAHVFDCLSDLAVDWSSDRMLSNFFVLTCPYVYDVEGIAYFPLLKNYHSPQAVATIANTTQILVDIYRHRDRYYLHPIKVQQRHSPTMYMLHAWEPQHETFRPVNDSSTIAEILTSRPWGSTEQGIARLGVWARAFREAEELVDPSLQKACSLEEKKHLHRRLMRMLISRDERILPLAEKYLNPARILEIRRRTLGTGLIGGKSVGMLLSRAILEQSDPKWSRRLEVHDSFYIGSDVFYTYLVQNGVWWLREKQRNPQNFLEGSEEARRRIITGSFSEETQKEFAEMLDYFGQSPIIVRSSSLLEDAYGNAFAGKYESLFCVNQGSRDKRLADFMSAVRTIYASTMSEKALQYRAQRGLLEKDEQMSLLVQRVSGSLHGNLFYPQVAGVGLSYNPYVWHEDIDPKAGMLRLVFGLGTRAVDRSDDDYTRVVALNAPGRRPEAGIDQVRRYTQRKVDALDLAANQLVSNDFVDVIRQSNDIPLQIFASRDSELERMAAETGRKDLFPWILTFDHLLSETSFVSDMREMVATLEKAYACPVDIEFTANFFEDSEYKINLVQCRPLQVAGGRADEAAEMPASIDPKDLVIEAHGAVIGQSRAAAIDRLVYVVPSVYGHLPIPERYAVARLIGRLMHADEEQKPERIMLLGPGRWGTTTPSLGVPVSFAEINTVSVLCEIVAMREDLVPDVSLGTHFFNELVELDILYLALFPGREGNFLNEEFFEKAPNKLTRLIPSAANWAHVIRVIDTADLGGRGHIQLNANNLSQRVVCYRSRTQ